MTIYDLGILLLALNSDLIGREREIAILNRAVDDAAEGAPSLILATGEPGIGKTRLVEEARRRAEGLGMEVLWGASWSEEGVPAFWPWVQIIRSFVQNRGRSSLIEDIGEGAADIAQIVPELLSLGGSLESPPVATPEQARFRLFEAIATWLRRAAANRPLMLVFDDLHAADYPTLLLLRFVVHELTSARFLLVGTFRDVEIDSENPLHQILEESMPNRQLVSLSGLRQEDLGSLIKGATDVAPSEEFVRAIHRETGGNPLFVKELTNLLLSQGKLDWDTGLKELIVPRGVRKVIERRLSRLSTSCRGLLSSASILGTSFQIEIAAAVAGLEVAEAIELLDEAERARLVSPTGSAAQNWRFEHGLVRESLYDALGTAARVRLHQKAGQSIETFYKSEGDAHLPEVAHHFLRSVTLTGPQRSADYLVRAGRLALRRLAYEEAIIHFQNAIEVAGRRADLLLELGDAMIRSGSFQAAKTIFDEVAEQARATGDAHLMAKAALGLGAGLSGFEITMRDQRQIDLLGEALTILGDEDSLLRAWVMARLSIASTYVSPAETRVELSLRAAEMADRLGDPAAKAYALSTFCDARSGPEYVDERLEAADEMIRLAKSVGDKEMELLGRRFRVVSLVEKGHRTALDEEIEAFGRVSSLLRQPLSSWYVPLFRAAIALMEGRFADCERLAGQAAEIAERAQTHNAFWFIDMTLLPQLWMQQDRVDKLETEFLPKMVQLQDMTGIDWPALSAAVVGIGSDIPARAELERLTANDKTDIPRDGMWLPNMYYLVLASERINNKPAAGVMYRELLPFADQFIVCGILGACYCAVHHLLALLAAVLEDWDSAEKHFDDALKAESSVGAFQQVTVTRYEYGRMLLRRQRHGDRERAEELLRLAASSYRYLGVDSAAERADSLLRASVTGGANVFRRAGDVWNLEFSRKASVLKDSKGLRDIAVLLARPNQEIHVSELIGAEALRGRSKAEGLTVGEGADDVLDATARDQFRVRLQEVQKELEEAEAHNDIGRTAKLQEEFDFLTSELAGAYGLAGRSRKLGDSSERARKAVAGRIRDAITKINKINPALGVHLQRSVKTGAFCSYAPEQPISWSL